MRVREAQGNLVEALRVHERLRTLLRDELGVAPGPQVQAEFERLLKAERAETAPAPAPPPRRRRPPRDRRTAAASSPPAAAPPSSAAAASSTACASTSTAPPRATASSCCSRASRGSARRGWRWSSWRRARAEGALALYGRCDAETLVPYQPFVEALRRYVVARARAGGRLAGPARRRARPRDPGAGGRAATRPAAPRRRSATGSSTPSPRCSTTSRATSRSCSCSTTCTGPTSRRC